MKRRSVTAGISGMKMKAAAVIFANGQRDPKRIAALTGVNARTIYRWATHPQWEAHLNSLDYQGNRSFKRKC